jgi:hypothetical protein
MAAFCGVSFRPHFFSCCHASPAGPSQSTDSAGSLAVEKTAANTGRGDLEWLTLHWSHAKAATALPAATRLADSMRVVASHLHMRFVIAAGARD